MSFHLRIVSPADREFILSMVGRFTQFDLPEWRTKAEIDAANQGSLIKALDEPEQGSVIWIAEDENGAPAGFIHLQTQTDYFNGEKHGYISDVAVDPAYEGQGVGRMLLEAAENWAKEEGFRLLTLYVFAGNTRAQRIYEKSGFRPEVMKYVKTLR